MNTIDTETAVPKQTDLTTSMGAPHMIMLSLHSRAANRRQYDRVVRAMLDACQHPLCSEAQRRILKQLLQTQQFRKWDAQSLMIPAADWPTFSLALRMFEPNNTQSQAYINVIKGRARYDRFVQGGYEYARRDF